MHHQANDGLLDHRREQFVLPGEILVQVGDAIIDALSDIAHIQRIRPLRLNDLLCRLDNRLPCACLTSLACLPFDQFMNKPPISERCTVLVYLAEETLSRGVCKSWLSPLLLWSLPHSFHDRPSWLHQGCGSNGDQLVAQRGVVASNPMCIGSVYKNRSPEGLTG